MKYKIRMIIASLVIVSSLIYANGSSANTSHSEQMLKCIGLKAGWTESNCAHIYKKNNFQLVGIGVGGVEWRSSATWLRSEYGRPKYLTYEGSGATKDAAWQSVKAQCRSHNGGLLAATCETTAVVEFRQVKRIGDAWSGWIEIGGAVGNPCPKGIERGRELGQAYRFVGILPPRPQTKHKFECIQTLDSSREYR